MLLMILLFKLITANDMKGVNLKADLSCFLDGNQYGYGLLSLRYLIATHKTKYLRQQYFNRPDITYTDDIFDKIHIPPEYRIKKPGKSSAAHYLVNRMIFDKIRSSAELKKEKQRNLESEQIHQKIKNMSQKKPFIVFDPDSNGIIICRTYKSLAALIYSIPIGKPAEMRRAADRLRKKIVLLESKDLNIPFQEIHGYRVWTKTACMDEVLSQCKKDKLYY